MTRAFKTENPPESGRPYPSVDVVDGPKDGIHDRVLDARCDDANEVIDVVCRCRRFLFTRMDGIFLCSFRREKDINIFG